MQTIASRLIKGIMLLPADGGAATAAVLPPQRSLLDFRGQRLLLEE